MARRSGTRGGGRPSKGPREFFATRVPVEIAERLRADAEKLDLSYSDYLANVLADKYGLPKVVVPQGTEQMKLTA